MDNTGLHPDNTIEILDRIVSKEHAQIIRQPDDRIVFRDLRSLNGNFLAEERVSEHVFNVGDEIVMGTTRLIYRAGSLAPVPTQQVTIEHSQETLIRQTIQTQRDDQEFLPEARITDLEVLRRDYEKLR